MRHALEEIQTRSAAFRLGEDGILRGRAIPIEDHTIEDARRNVDAARIAAAGRRCPLLLDLREATAIDRESRAYYSGPRSAEVNSACAFLVGSPLSRVIGNFFLGFQRPAFPLQLFTDEQAALEWLAGYVTDEVAAEERESLPTRSPG